MFEVEWWETALEDLARTPPSERSKRARKLADDYFSIVETEKKSRREVLSLLEDIIRHLESPLPPFMIVSAPAADKIEAGELILEPAWNQFEADRLREMHDYRSRGSMVLGIYKLNREEPLPNYRRVEER